MKKLIPKNQTGNLIQNQVSKQDATKIIIPKTERFNQEESNYYNPIVEKGITSGDWKQDLLYNNQWLFDMPIIGDIIKKKAEEVARISGGSERIRDISTREKAIETGQLSPYTGAGSPYGGDKSIDLVGQYFNKNKLENSIYKPKSDYLTFLPSYSVKGKTNVRREDMIDAINQLVDNSDSIYEDFIKNKKPIYKTEDYNSRLMQITGTNLGGHKTGLAWDKSINLPYASLSDAWDFEPNHYSKKWLNKYETPTLEDIKNTEQDRQLTKIQATLMHKSGNPFKIYDRFYFDPKTKEYITDNSIQSLKKSIGITPIIDEATNKDYSKYFKLKVGGRLISKNQKGSTGMKWLAEDIIRTPQQRAVIAHQNEPGFGQRMSNEAWSSVNTLGSLTPAWPLFAANEAGRQVDQGNIRQGIAEAAMIAVPSLIGKGIKVASPYIKQGIGKVSEIISEPSIINPWAFKPTSGMMYRGLGSEGYQDAITSGVFRPKVSGTAVTIPTGKINLEKKFTKTYYTPAEKFATVKNYGSGYLAEVPISSGNFRNRYAADKSWSQLTEREIPVNEGNILKKDWLRGYKPILKPGSTIITNSNEILPKVSISSNIIDILNRPIFPISFAKKRIIAKEAMNAKEEGISWIKSWINHPESQVRISNIESNFASTQDKWDDLNNFTPSNSKHLLPEISDISRINRMYKNLNPDIKLFSTSGLNRGYLFPKSKAGIGSGLSIDSRGTSWPDGKYFINRNMEPKQITSTTIHEGTHNLTNNEVNNTIEDITSNSVGKYDPNIKMDAIGGVGNYLKDPTEVYARVMQLRHQFGFKPGQIIDMSTSNSIIDQGLVGKTLIDPGFFKQIKSNPAFNALFNKLPVAAGVTISGIGASQNK